MNQHATIIRLISGVQNIANSDPDVGDLLKVFFLPNFNFLLAQVIIRDIDLSEHTSTVGMEAWGTLTMKFLMNGGLIIWTTDVANIEIREETMENKMLTFGLLTPEIDSARSKMEHSEYKVHDDCISEAIGQIRNNIYCGSGNSGPILSRNSINLLVRGWWCTGVEINLEHQRDSVE